MAAMAFLFHKDMDLSFSLGTNTKRYNESSQNLRVDFCQSFPVFCRKISCLKNEQGFCAAEPTQKAGWADAGAPLAR